MEAIGMFYLKSDWGCRMKIARDYSKLLITAIFVEISSRSDLLFSIIIKKKLPKFAQNGAKVIACLGSYGISKKPRLSIARSRLGPITSFHNC